MLVRSRNLPGACLVFSGLVLLFAAACGRPVGQPVLDKDVMDFGTLYSENCSGCHGADGMNGAAPALNSPVFLALIPQDALRQIVEHGVPGTPMPAFAQSEGGELNPPQVEALLSGMEQKWAKPSEVNGAILPSYSAATGAGDIARGKQVFATACDRCHGDQGQAGSITNASFLSLVSDQGLRTSTIVGRPDFGIPDWRGYIPQHALTNQEITDVVAYLASLRKQR
jgi:cytochrome c oxidase cbb3-type subunit III